jgi:hypothetical protein
VVPKKIAKKVHTTLPVSSASVMQRKAVEMRGSSGDGTLAGFGIGTVVVFLLLRVMF